MTFTDIPKINCFLNISRIKSKPKLVPQYQNSKTKSASKPKPENQKFWFWRMSSEDHSLLEISARKDQSKWEIVSKGSP